MAAMFEERSAEAARASVSNRARRSGVGLRLGRQELQRDLATEPGVLGEIDLAHPARPEPLADPIVLDRAADHPSILSDAACDTTPVPLE